MHFLIDDFRRCGCSTSLVAILVLLVCPETLLRAQDAGQLDARHIPEDALVGIVATTKGMLENPDWAMLPIEVFRVQGKENLGIDPADLVEIRAAVTLDQQTMQPKFGVIAKVDGEINWQVLFQAMNVRGDPIQLEGTKAYPVNGPPGAVLTRLDANTIYMGTADYFTVMRDATGESGDLPKLISSMPAGDGLAVAMAMEQIRPMVSGLAMQQSGALAPELQPLARIPELTDAVKLHAGFDGLTGSMSLSLVGIGEPEAERIEGILGDAIQSARRLGVAEISRNTVQAGQSAEMNDAIDGYANRLADMFVKQLTPTRSGDHVTVTLDSQLGFASTGVLVGLLLPAVQAAREAARRMDTSNHLKQIMLAMHNHHSAYKQLPLSAIVDDEGNPLLSWRVKLLPFIEEQALYQEFHLDEPWDSEHNLPLSKRLPTVYQAPGKNLGEGLTTYQALVGEGLALEPLEKTRFRDYLDGLSNTIMVVETDDDQAVVWSKPEDIEIDLEQPRRGLGNARQGGFYVALADGAVIFVSNSVEPGLLKKLMTRAGKEVIDQPL